ncbi:MAG TPA: hypothetical protein PK635_15815, partial [Actinomycetota bacterium]|nr:hypothetical protein [Actinomycetota bacterium]
RAPVLFGAICLGGTPTASDLQVGAYARPLPAGDVEPNQASSRYVLLRLSHAQVRSVSRPGCIFGVCT